MRHGTRPRTARRIALAVAPITVVALCLAAEAAFRWSGAKNDALWGVGLILYAVLVNSAVGPAVDGRARSSRDGFTRVGSGIDVFEIEPEEAQRRG